MPRRAPRTAPHDVFHPLFPYLPTAQNAVLAPGELVVDNFAGLGGASSGIERALGRPVDIAINHDRNAIELHRQNHPYTRHYVEDVWQVDPLHATGGQPVALCWFSPDCKHFSVAKGGKPVEKNIRGLAWVALRWADLVRPRVIVLENVKEFQTWCRIGPNGRPDPRHLGETFRSFVNALRHLGYAVEWRVLSACDYGAPTIRARLFLVARCDGRPIVWPEPTHAAPHSAAVRAGRLKPWRTAAECIDWDQPVPSIFGRRKELVEATNRRIARGIQKFVLDAARPFLVTCNHAGESFRGQSLAEPMRTLTAARDAHGLVTPIVVRTDMHKSNAMCAYPAEAPITTITTAQGHAVASGVLAPLVTNRQHKNPPRSVDEPLSVVTTNHNKNELVAGYLVPRYGERPEQAPRAVGVDTPAPTVTPTENGSRLAVAHLTKFRRDTPGQSAEEPIDTVTAGGMHFGVVATCLMQDVSGRTRPEDAVYAADRPARVIAAQGCRQNLLTGALVGLGGRAGQSRPRGLGEPTATATTKADTAVAAAFLTQYNRDAAPKPTAEPLRTQSTRDRFALTRATLTPALPDDLLAAARRVRAFLAQHLPEGALAGHEDAELGIVTVRIDGEVYILVDIGMRMLDARELARCQGFSEKYVLDATLDGRRLSKSVQVRGVGNSVCPDVAEAVVRANLSEVASQEAAD